MKFTHTHRQTHRHTDTHTHRHTHTHTHTPHRSTHACVQSVSHQNTVIAFSEKRKKKKKKKKVKYICWMKPYYHHHHHHHICLMNDLTVWPHQQSDHTTLQLMACSVRSCTYRLSAFPPSKMSVLLQPQMDFRYCVYLLLNFTTTILPLLIINIPAPYLSNDLPVMWHRFFFF